MLLDSFQREMLVKLKENTNFSFLEKKNPDFSCEQFLAQFRPLKINVRSLM